MTLEENARQQIDAMLIAVGWAIQDYKALNLGAAQGIAVREVPLKSGRCDYLLLVDRVPVGVVEAKKEGTTLSTVADQSGHYAENLPDFLAKLAPGKLRFLYESTGVETCFRDERDPHPRSRPVFAFHCPETLAEWLERPDTLRPRVAAMPFAHPLTKAGMRDCQVEGITNLEQSFAEAKPRALIQMATGAGKTFTACAFTYRLIKARSTRRRRARQGERGGARQFRLSPPLRIAVTVDMIATGTDITAPRGSAFSKRGATSQSPAESRDHPLEVLLFLRDVRSRVYFEQMKGRGTRALTPSEMQAVSGEDARTKDHFVIVDAVGVCDSDKTESRPLERLPGVRLEKMLKHVAFGDRSEDTLTFLASRLARLDRAITAPRRAELTQLAGGQTLADLSAALLRAFDPDVIAEKATGIPGASPDEVEPALFERTRAQLALEACKPLHEPALRDAITDARQEADQIIDVVAVDKVTSQGFDAAAKEKAEGLVRSFREYIEQHHAEIEALEILYSRSYRQRLTEEALKELERKLRDTPAHWTPDTLAAACRQVAPAKVRGQLRRFTDLVSLVRFALEQEPILEPFEEHFRQRFNTWLEEKRAAGTTFEPDQLAWLEKMRDYISASGSVDRGHLEADNVLGPIYRAFGERLWPLMEELNLTLAA